ncbi:MAG: hypothetical protein JWM11_7103, partial [Planctomycetaceae bacterium]|nr:hypothetical protein [Planctomycetaceae bacterium]
MRRRISLCLVALGLWCGIAAIRAEEPKKEVPVVPPREGKSESYDLFNGKDLEGWEGHTKLWSAKDGIIIA